MCIKWFSRCSNYNSLHRNATSNNFDQSVEVCHSANRQSRYAHMLPSKKLRSADLSDRCVKKREKLMFTWLGRALVARASLMAICSATKSHGKACAQQQQRQPIRSSASLCKPHWANQQPLRLGSSWSASQQPFEQVVFASSSW